MKLLTLTTSAIFAATASAQIGINFGLSSKSSPKASPLDDSLSVPGKNPLEHCQDPKDDILAVKSVDLDPNPPQAGQTLTVTASGVLAEDVEEGATVHLQVKYGLITIIRQTADLCETVKNVDLECPLKKGDLSLTKDVDLPKEIPPGKYTVVADVLSKDEDKITCLTSTVQFSRGGKVEIVEQFKKEGL